MLMQIRERASGILAYIIVILISIPFAFWGIQEYLGGGSDQNVAEVNDTEITKRVFDRQLQEQKRYLKSLLGTSYEKLYPVDDQLKQTVLDNLIENTLLNDETKDAGYKVSDSQLLERIMSVPQFQNDGKFDPIRYEQILASQRRGKVEFEEQLRQEARVNQYQGSIVYSSFLPGADKVQLASLKTQKRKFNYFFVQVDANENEISQEDIATYYETNKVNFKSPAKVKLEFVEIKQQDIADALKFTEDELLAIYDDDPNRYRSAELRSASHILFKLDENASEEQVEAAFVKANDVSEKIKGGSEFSVVAKDYSEDSVSANKGGNLGFLSRTDIDNPVFMDKLFALSAGETSDPIRTRLGVQIVRLDDITPSELQPFAEVRSRIESELRSQAAEEEFIRQAEVLQELSYEYEDTLSVASENLQLQIQFSDWISKLTTEGIASHQKVITTAFSDDVLNKRYNSELLELSTGHVAVIRVSEYEDAKTKSIEEVSNSIKQTLARKNVLERSSQKGMEIINQLQKDPNQMEEIAKQNDYPLVSYDALLRNDESVSEEILTRVFQMPIPKNDQAELDGFISSDGRFAVIRLTQVEEVTDTQGAIDAADWISMQGKYGRREMSSMLKALRETGDVKVFPEHL